MVTNRLRAGTRVRFAEETGDKGPQASTVKVIHPRKQAQTAATTEVLPRKLAGAWSGEPPGTQSFALIMDDPDAPAGTWNHWLLWDILGGVHSMPQHYRAARPVHSGTNDFGKPSYGGPCPPKRGGPHRYFFRLYAVGTPTLGLPQGARREELERALQRHRLGVIEYMGKFERK
jgi:Raf kinase inhibitor-like YbhB/YbcL family protein